MHEIPQLLSLKDNKSIRYQIQSELSKALEKVFDAEVSLDQIEVNKTADDKFGDLTTNIALKLSKEVGKTPREVAQMLIDSKLVIEGVTKIEIAGPGFINFFLSRPYFIKTLNKIIEEDEVYGSWGLGANKQVMVEFGQPNTHKAITAGHVKSGITGLSIARIIRNLGHQVIQANYFSDIGLNTAKSTWGFIKLGEPEGFKNWSIAEKMKYVANCYVFASKEFKEHDEVATEIRVINQKIYEKSDPEIYSIYLKLREISIEQQNEVFAKLGVVYDRQFAESETVELGTKLVQDNIGKVFIVDQGAIIFPGEKYNLNRWVFINNQGLPTYSGKDLGLAYKKFMEFPDLTFCLMMTSTEQNSYFAAIIKALELIDEKFKNRYFFKGFGWLLRDHKKMNSKSGNAVGVDDLFNDAYQYAKNKVSGTKEFTQEEVQGIAEKVVLAGLKFLFLSREFHMDINYDPEQFLNPEGFSGPYLLYGYVRAKSILRQAGVELSKEQATLEYKLNNAELKILKLLAEFPLVTLNAGKTLSPHLIANYLFDLTQSFNSFYKDNKVLVNDGTIKSFRLTLTTAVSIVLKNGLYLLGIETIEQM